MNKLTPSLEAETDALRETYAALNLNDIEAAVKTFDPQIVWIEPAEYPGGGTYYGHATVKAHLSRTRSTWAVGSFEPERFIVAGDKVIVFISVRVRLKYETEWREGRHAAVYTFHNGKTIEMRKFADKRQALKWAWVKHSDANQFWGDRMGSLIDPFGHHWLIATHVEDVDPSEFQGRMEAFFAANQARGK